MGRYIGMIVDKNALPYKYSKDVNLSESAISLMNYGYFLYQFIKRVGNLSTWPNEKTDNVSLILMEE